MEYIPVLIICAILYFIVFEVSMKKIKEAAEDKELDELVNKFPENEEICKSILKKLGNEKVKIKENEDKDNKTSLYIAITDTIFIANIKDTYTRIQTIAHECLHSIQIRRLLLFNFYYSNVYLLYYVLSIMLTIFGVFKNYNLQIIILTFMGFVYYAIRSFLETDAMTKAKYVAKEYMNDYIKENKVCTKQEVEKISNKYDEINEIGIPATNFVLARSVVMKIAIYTLVVIILSFVR